MKRFLPLLAAVPLAAAAQVDSLVRTYKELESSIEAMPPFASAASAKTRFTSMGFGCVSTEPYMEYSELTCLRSLSSETCFYYQTVKVRSELDGSSVFDVQATRGPITCEDRRHSEPDPVVSDPMYLGCELEEAITKKRRTRYLFEFRSAANSLTLIQPREGAHIRRLPFQITANSAAGLGGVTTASFQDFKYDAAQFSVNPFGGGAQMTYMRKQSAEECRQSRDRDRRNSVCGLVIIDYPEYGQCKHLWRTRDYDGHPILWLKRPKNEASPRK